jgi:hypothetical protein
MALNVLSSLPFVIKWGELFQNLNAGFYQTAL